MKKILAVVLASLLVFSLALGCSGKISYTPGTYTSTQAGHNGFVEVQVSFSKDAITGIEVVKSFETSGVADKAILTDLPQEIIAKQSLSVDTITGATVSSYAMLRAVEDCVTQAGGKPEALKAAKAVVAPTEINKTADVVIVGGGGSGLAAAVAASQNGASVIIIEKTGYVGGNTMVSGGIYNAPDPEMQKAVPTSPGVERLVTSAIGERAVSNDHAALMNTVRDEFNAYKRSGSTSLFDNPNWFALQTWNGGDKVADLSLVKTLANNSLDSLHWLLSMGYEMRGDIVQGAGALYQRTHSSIKPLGTGFIDAYMNTIKGMPNVEILYDSTAKELVMNNGRVSAVKGTDRDGNSFVINANKAVILSTGGFAGNPSMVQKFNTSGKWSDLSKAKNTNLPGITGDGITMAQSVGAAVRDMDQIQLLQVCSPKTGKLHANVYPKSVGGYLFLNKEGKRFVREDGRRDDISLAALKQTDGVFYLIQSGDSIPDPSTASDLAKIPLADLIAMGDVLVADTLAEACALVGMNAANAQATIDAYNKVVDQGTGTDEFGRALFIQKFEKGPWYVIPRAPSVHHTMGGVVINTDCQVIDTNGKVIPGLYAAGEVVGGVHGGNRLGGNAIVDTVVFGRIAGTQASK